MTISSVNNINQLLIRNIDTLTSASPLLVNIADDGFIEHYLQTNLAQYPTAIINSYHTNFSDYLQAKKVENKQVKTHFCVEYETEERHDLIIMTFPKSKAEFNFTLAILAESITEDANIIIVGENKSGIKSCEKLSKIYLDFCNKIDAARHCLLYIGKFKPELPTFNIENFYTYYQITVGSHEIKVAALPGVFSQKNLDIGTNILLQNLPKNIVGTVLDFGCGAGVIAAYIGTLHPETQLSLVDVSALALHSARKTLIVNQLSGEFIASNSLSHVKKRYDFVVSNPPFHQGIKTNYTATEYFLSAIKKNITHCGCITIVANSFLKYMPIMEKHIGETQILAVKNGFSIYQCHLNYKNNK